MSPTRPTKRARLITRGVEVSHDSFSFEKPGLSSTLSQGKYAFNWLLGKLSIEKFFSEYFEKKPIILHNEPSKFQELDSVEIIKELVHSGKLRYGSDIDVTRYASSTGRETFNGKQGEFAKKEAWKFFMHSGCSMRLLRPQEHSDALWNLCSQLETFLSCVVGANIYLTPTASQGFAPHFDDIDAFVCQISGRKRWRVYAPRPDGLDELPRASSIDFSKEDMKASAVLFDQVLVPGDLLYLPRGTVHEAKCPEQDGGAEHDLDHCSLHVTISAFQKWTWADLLLESCELAIQSAAANDRALRRTLPLRFTDFIGVSKGDARKEQREWFEKMVENMVRRVGKAYTTDAAGDALATRFIRQRLPPPSHFTRRKACSTEVRLQSAIRTIGGGIARIVMDHSSGGDGLPRLVHCLNNSRGALEETGDETSVPCLPEEALAVDFVIKRYPRYVIVKELPLEDEEDRLELVRGLVDMGILEIKR